MNAKQNEIMRTGKGFIAALDQSGGSTPKALKLYGIDESKYKGEDQMFDMIHQARTRLITSPSFTSDRVLAAILFEQTMDREIGGKPSATYLCENKGTVPILKIDKGLAAEADGVQLMKPVPDLDRLLERAVKKGIYGTKERSVIKEANPAGIKAIAAQQFEWGKQVLAHGLVPILEPEVDIKSPNEACDKLAKNHGLIASFSRALAENLTASRRALQTLLVVSTKGYPVSRVLPSMRRMGRDHQRCGAIRR